MKKIINFKNFTTCIVIFIVMIITSCSDVLQMTETVTTEMRLQDGVPMVMNVRIDACDSSTRAEEYEWPDGSILIIRQHIPPAFMVYAVYSKETGWTVYGLNELGEFPEVECGVYYYESLSYDEIKKVDWSSIEFLGDINNTLSSKATEVAYRSLWYDEQGERQNNSTCAYKDGIFYLTSILKPTYGRVRFISDNPITVEYNHACYGFIFEDNSSVNAATSDHLIFHKENDGKYYSDYIYSIAVPELKIGEYVYKHRGNCVIRPGTSVCITLPKFTETTSNWICEKYFEIVYSDEKNITLGFRNYYQQITQTISSNTGNEEYGGRNTINSDVGLSIEISFKINSNDSYFYQKLNKEIYYSNLPIKEPSLNSREQKFYEGEGRSKEIIGQSQLLKIHNCHTDTSNSFCPYLSSYKDINITLYYTKISNF